MYNIHYLRTYTTESEIPMVTNIFVVTSSYYTGETIKEMLQKNLGEAVAVRTIYRTYHVPDIHSGDVIVSDGTCKDHAEGKSYPVYFDLTKTALESDASHVSFAPQRGNQPRTKGLVALLRQWIQISGPKPQEVTLDKILADVRTCLS